jgi:hypothetical protein
MRRTLGLLIGPLTAGVLMAALAHAGENETTRFLGSEADWTLARLELRDVHGLWGGSHIALAASGSACVRIVDKTGEERRFVFAIDKKDALATFKLAAEQDLLGVKVKERAGVPDEGRPQLVLENALGLTRPVFRWQNDKVPPLEKVEQALRALEKKCETLEPVFRGKQDPYFRPLAGVQVTVALSAGRPDPTFELVRPEDWEKLKGMLKDLGAAERPSDKEAPTGFRGFLLTPRGLDGVPKWISVFKGTIQLGDTPRDRSYKKDDKGLEAWLKAEATKRGAEVPK